MHSRNRESCVFGAFVAAMACYSLIKHIFLFEFEQQQGKREKLKIKYLWKHKKQSNATAVARTILSSSFSSKKNTTRRKAINRTRIWIYSVSVCILVHCRRNQSIFFALSPFPSVVTKLRLYTFVDVIHHGFPFTLRLFSFSLFQNHFQK